MNEENAFDAEGAESLDIYDEPSNEPDGQVEPSNNTVVSDNNLIPELLAANGIDDPTRIKFEEDDGTIVERDWRNLSKDERLGVLSTSGDSSLTMEETDFLQSVRDSGLSVDEYLAMSNNEAAENAVYNAQAEIPPTYTIDSMSDDELFIADALDRYEDEDITNEQVWNLLQNVKKDPDLYAKTISSLRTQYKNKEDELRYAEQQEIQDRKRQEKDAADEYILDAIQDFTYNNNIGIELSKEDMNDLADYLLSSDYKGATKFYSVLQDPRMLVESAFWLLKGRTMLSEMDRQMQAAYRRGIEVGRQGTSRLAFNTKNRGLVYGNQTSADALDVD